MLIIVMLRMLNHSCKELVNQNRTWMVQFLMKLLLLQPVMTKYNSAYGITHCHQD